MNNSCCLSEKACGYAEGAFPQAVLKNQVSVKHYVLLSDNKKFLHCSRRL